MRITILFVAGSLGVLLAGQWTPRAATSQERDGAERPYGIEKRAFWTGSIKGSPDPPAPYRTQRAFPKLTFNEPLALTDAPGTDRLYVAERYGKIFSLANDPQVERAELFLDLVKAMELPTPKSATIYGLAFHPRFQQNGYVYVTYVFDAGKGSRGPRVSRFHVDPDDPRRCDPASEKVVLEWSLRGHNGGCIKFGHDGYLYVATGDGDDTEGYPTGQNINNLWGSILRIDVDHPDKGKGYAIPADNPFVGVEGARAEIWAYGLRQPWKLSFDRATGDLWTGNVGQDLWEQIYRVERGANYGWSVTEGSHPYRPEHNRGPTPVIPPTAEHGHAEARSITGGFVYRGGRLDELVGVYVYGDYDTGKVWGLRYEDQKVTWHKELVDTNLRIVGFGEDSTGELYLVDHVSGGLYRLVATAAAEDTQPFPRKLSETGLFASTRQLIPAPGLIPYSVNSPMWSDGAQAERYLALPGKSTIEFETITFPNVGGVPGGWKFPDGAVLVKTHFLEMERGNPNSRRRLETQILHHERLVGSEEMGDQFWRSYTYLWNDVQTDAVLLEDPNGLDRTFTIADPDAPGGKRRQTWHFASRSECLACHNMAAKYAIGVNTLQMNKRHDYGGVVDNQLRTLEHLGVFSEPLPAPPEELPHLPDYSDESQDLGQRARAYLHANCAHCHRTYGGGNADFRLRFSLDFPEAGVEGARPGQGTFLIPGARVVAAGHSHRSVLFYRMAKLGPGRMPRAGSQVVDERGLQLIHDWIAQLPPKADAPADAQLLAEAEAQHVAALKRLRTRKDISAEARDRDIDRLLASTSGAVRLMRVAGDASLAESTRNEIVVRAARHEDTNVRDLFERFLPEEQRTKRLAGAINQEQLLALPGDVQEGQRVFFEAAGVQCKSCHRINGAGQEVGPDLSKIGKKFNRAQLLETIFDPSKQIEEKYVMYLLETLEGRVYTGLVVERSPDAIVLKDGKGKLIRVPADDVERIVPQQKSLMPELLLRDMTARQVADLIAYMSSLQ